MKRVPRILAGLSGYSFALTPYVAVKSSAAVGWGVHVQWAFFYLSLWFFNPGVLDDDGFISPF